MLAKVSKALLISDVTDFAESYKALASEVEVSLSVADDWNERFRVSAEVVILGSKFLNKLNKAYYPQAVLILKDKESPAPYIKQGICHFIFNYKNNYELLCAFFKLEKVVLHASDEDLSMIIKNSSAMSYVFGDYDFQFEKNVYKYKGKGIYFADSSKRYLAEWLLNGHKDNARRMILFNLRKKFGKDFLRDVDRFGQIKGGKK